MVGIISYGAYIPFYRLSRKLIAQTWGTPSRGGEKAVANWDEDSVTMAVEAALNALEGIDPDLIEGVFFASTTSPYKDKMASSLIADVLDLSSHVDVRDFSGSTRAGTIALKAAWEVLRTGSNKNILVVASDLMLAEPGSALEQNVGDGAAALLIGTSEDGILLEGYCSIAQDFMDYWRKDKDSFIRSGDARFIQTYGYEEGIIRVTEEIFGKYHVNPKDINRLIMYCPDGRSHIALAKRMGFKTEQQLGDPLFNQIGNCGSAASFMSLIYCLENAVPSQRILLLNYGDGADAFLFLTGQGIERLKKKKGVKTYLGWKKELSNYQRYLGFRRLIKKED